MSDRNWDRAKFAKLAFGVALSAVIAMATDVLTRHWPAGGAR